MLQAVHGWSSTYERLVKSQKFFSSYLTQEDLSRVGRDHITVGYYIEEFFPMKNVRFVSVTDQFDTVNGLTDQSTPKRPQIRIPLTNVFNEQAAIDIKNKTAFA